MIAGSCALILPLVLALGAAACWEEDSAASADAQPEIETADLQTEPSALRDRIETATAPTKEQRRHR